MDLRQWARRPEAATTPAKAVVPWRWVQILSVWRHKELRELSVLEFVMALARLGGHLNRQGDGLPGWQTPWRGWNKVQAMLQFDEAMRQAEAKCV